MLPPLVGARRFAPARRRSPSIPLAVADGREPSDTSRRLASQDGGSLSLRMLGLPKGSVLRGRGGDSPQGSCATDSAPPPTLPPPQRAPPSLATTSKLAPAQPRHDLQARPRPASRRPRSAHVPHATTGAASLIGERASDSRAERRASAAPTRRRCAPPVSQTHAPGCQSAACACVGETRERATDSHGVFRHDLPGRSIPSPHPPPAPPAQPRPDLKFAPRPARAQPRSATVPPSTTGAASLIGERASSSRAERRADKHSRRRFLRRRPAQRAL